LCNRIVLAWSGAKRSGTCSGISTHAAKRGHHCQTHRLSNRWLHRLHTAVELLVPRLVVDQDVASRLQLLEQRGQAHAVASAHMREREVTTAKTHRLSNRWLHRLHTAVELLVPRLVVDQDVASRLQLVLIKGVDHRPSLLSSEQLPRQPVAQPSERPAAPPAPQRWLGESLVGLAAQQCAQQQW
jgi:hypothetical protein